MSEQIDAAAEVPKRTLSFDRLYAADRPEGETYLAFYYGDLTATCVLSAEEARALGAFLNSRPASTSGTETEPNA